MNEDAQYPLHPDEPSGFVSRGFVILLAFAVVTSFWGLDAGPALGDHEAIVAQCARQIRQSGDWLIPHFNDVPFIRKPPLQPWLVAACSYTLDPPDLDPPVSPLAARFPSALAAVLTVLVVYHLCRSMLRPRAALVAGGIMACCGGTLFFSHNAQTEMVLTLLTTASLACFYKSVVRPASRLRYLIAFYLCLSLAMIAKAPLPLAVVGLPVFIYWFVTMPLADAVNRDDRTVGFLTALLAGMINQLIRLRDLWLIPGVLLFLALALPWPLYVYLNVDNAIPLWRTEFIDRYVGLLSDEVEPFWYYLPLVLAMMVPFCLSIPEALAAPFRRVFRKERAGLLFALTWVVVNLMFLSTSAFKRPHYLLPAVPGFCVLLAPVIDRMFLGPIRFDLRRVRLVLLAICTSLIIAAPICIYQVRREAPDLLWASGIGLMILFGGTGWASYLFWIQKRQASLLAIFVLPLMLFAWSWSSLGRSRFEKAVVELASQLKQLSIGANDQVTWALGRPDARLGYYAGFQIHPLYSPLEMATRRRGRLEVPQDVLLEGASRIAERLESKQEEYFIFDDLDALEMFKTIMSADYREVLRIQTDPNDDDEVLVVITNKWNTGEEEDWQAGRGMPPPVFPPEVQGSGTFRELPVEEPSAIAFHHLGAGRCSWQAMSNQGLKGVTISVDQVSGYLPA